jgi:hypothetical protein
VRRARALGALAPLRWSICGEGSFLSLRPDLTEIVSSLSRFEDAVPVAGEDGEVLAVERDAVSASPRQDVTLDLDCIIRSHACEVSPGRRQPILPPSFPAACPW